MPQPPPGRGSRGPAIAVVLVLVMGAIGVIGAGAVAVSGNGSETHTASADGPPPGPVARPDPTVPIGPGDPWSPGSDPDPAAGGGVPALESPSDPRVVGGGLVVLELNAIVGVDTDLAPVWWAPCPGPAWASPITSRNPDVDVVACSDGYTAVDGRSGEVLWTRPIEGESDRVRVAPSTLLLQKDGVGVTVIDLMTGEHRFDVDVPASANVAGDEDHLYRSSNTGVDAYDLSTGEEVWSSPSPASGLIATGAGVFARTNDHRVLRLDAATGEVAQAHETRRHDALAWSDFVHADDDVVVLRNTDDLTVSVYDARSLELLWSLPGEGQTYVHGASGLVAISDVGREDVTVYDARSGAVLATVTEVITSAPAIGDDRLYLTQLDLDDGTTTLVAHQIR